MDVKTKRVSSTKVWFILLFLLAVVLGIAYGGTFNVSAASSGDYEYEVLDNDTVEITKYIGNDTEVVIPAEIEEKKVTVIGSHTFSECGLTSIDIPDSITTIGNSAFYKCSNLKEIVIPDSVKIIEKSAFSDCVSLANITIGSNVQKIRSFAFHNCKSLTNLIIPENVDYLGRYAFDGCTGLVSVTIPNVLYIDTTIYDELYENLCPFAYCSNLTEINVVNVSEHGLYSSIDGVLFNASGTELIEYPCNKPAENYNVPDGVTVIGRYAFYKCHNLKKVTMASSVERIDECAFYGSYSLTDAIIGKGVLTVGEVAFRDCKNLKYVKIGHFVKKISMGAFAGCESLTDILFPVYVRTIEDGAFVGCDSLTEFKVVYNNNWYFSADGILFAKPTPSFSKINGILIQCPQNRSGICVIPDGVTTIEYTSFDACKKLTGLIVPESVNKIPDGVFKSCSNLTLYGWAGSYIESYANKNNIPFSALEDMQNNSTITAKNIVLGESITLTGIASGGPGKYQYAMIARHSTESEYTILKKYSSAATEVDWTPSKTGVYSVIIKVKDAWGKVIQKFFTVTVVEESLKNNSTIAIKNIVLGEDIIMTGAATGGSGEYQYAMVSKHSTESRYVVLKNYDSSETACWKPSKTGKYSVIIKVKDSYGNVVQKFFTVTVVDEALKNNSNITATNILLGEGITMTGAATGGSGEYQYAMVVKHSTESQYTILRNYEPAETIYWEPSETGKYSVIIKVKDSYGNIVQKFFTLQVTENVLQEQFIDNQMEQNYIRRSNCVY